MQINQLNSSLFSFSSPFLIIEKAKMGLLKDDADQLGKAYSISDREMARILNISERSFHRYKADTKLDTVASERLLQLKNLYDYGIEIFEDEAQFKRWLRRPLRVLGNNSPLELLDTAMGFQIVNDELMRIEYGVFA